MKILFAGGVTGGHIAPAIALADWILDHLPGSSVLFASVDNAVERRMIADHGLPLRRIAGEHPGPLHRLIELPLAFCRARRILHTFQPDVVVGLGGGASVGAAAAAILARRPLVLLEQNAVPGRTNRRLARWAALVCCQFETAAQALGPTAAFTGSPVRQNIAAARALDPAASRAALGLDPARTTVLAMGGSQGARAIDQAMTAAAPRLARRCQVVHLARTEHQTQVAEAYRRAGLTAHVACFFDQMEFVYSAADLALCRAGATTLAELAAAGLPAILVPYPFATDRHQHANARDAAQHGRAMLLDQNELDGDRAAECITDLLADPARLAAMTDAAQADARPDAAELLAKTLNSLSDGASRIAKIDAGHTPATGAGETV